MNENPEDALRVFIDPSTVHVWRISGCQIRENEQWCNKPAAWVITASVNVPYAGETVKFLCNEHGDNIGQESTPTLAEALLHNDPPNES